MHSYGHFPDGSENLNNIDMAGTKEDVQTVWTFYLIDSFALLNAPRVLFGMVRKP